MANPTPEAFLEDVINTWEDLGGKDILSLNPNDSGNWYDGVLIGSQHGVTAPALAQHRGIPTSEVTPAMMRTVTLKEAAAIGQSQYFNVVHENQLLWGPVTAALLDWGWMSGPTYPIRHTQVLCGAVSDGAIGPATVAAYNAWIARVGWASAMQLMHSTKEAYFRSLGQPEFLQGWLNRNDWCSSKNAKWWSQWDLRLTSPSLSESIVNALHNL